MDLYQLAAPVIKHGTSRIFGNLGPSWRHPKGWQAVRRISRDGTRAMLVLHGFADAPTTIELPWPDGDWRLTDKLADSSEISPKIREGRLSLPMWGDFSGSVCLFQHE
jgi:alpha-galactosidase